MHIWNRPWPFIYEHHNRVPMLLSVIFYEIATLVWNFYWAHKFVACWIIYSCVYFYLWPFRFVAVPVCGRFGLWPFRSLAVPVCGRFGLWPFRSVAVPVRGRFGLWPFWFWPFRFVAVMTRIQYNYRWHCHLLYGLIHLWYLASIAGNQVSSKQLFLTFPLRYFAVTTKGCCSFHVV